MIEALFHPMNGSSFIVTWNKSPENPMSEKNYGDAERVQRLMLTEMK